MPSEPLPNDEAIKAAVHRIVENVRVVDMHTHLFAPEFGALNLWGVDELLNYHYLIAELFRVTPIRYDDWWTMPRKDQADMIWSELFVKRPPISEATQGVVRVLSAFGLDPTAPDLRQSREFFAAQRAHEHAEHVLDMAGVDWVVMTNDPLDPDEAPIWREGRTPNPRYRAALRLDRLLNGWPEACEELKAQGYDVTPDVSGDSFHEGRRFLGAWIGRMKPLYMAVSLPADFRFPEDDARTRLLRGVVLPTCLEHRMPLALMIGVRRQVNPNMRLAGDAVGHADIGSVERLASEYPQVRYLITMLARENQHELCVSARKFRSLLPFGCWWFLNNPSIVREITQERLEMLGATFVAQHSDARVLDQLLYKWPVSRKIIAGALTETYCSLADAGRPVTEADIEADVQRLLSDNFRAWVGAD
jgi:hypothetical protein